MRRRLLEGAATLLIVSVMTVGLLEGIVVWSLRFPHLTLLPVTLSRYLYVRFDRNTIQVMPECARYDPDVTYTLRPGSCRFTNREFSNEFRINSAGLRDDEQSLEQPEIIVAGDSVAMGWGVEQDEAFPAVLERLTGRRTLNAGVSSYGTVRELRLLKRLDRRALRVLIVQHSDNDALENEQFLTNPAFRTLSQAEYQRTVDEQQRTLRYFPGQYSFNIALQLRRLLLGGGQPTARADALVPVETQAARFFKVLERSPVELDGIALVVLSVDPAFIAAAKAAAPPALPGIRALTFADVGQQLEAAHAFYTLDDHPTAKGHDIMAAVLAAAIRQYF